MTDSLNRLRDEIDEINEELVRLFGRRMAVCERIARYKREHGLPVADPKREDEILSRVSALANPEDEADVRALFAELMRLSRERQNRLLSSGRYGLLGKTLKHSYSPQLHAMLGDPSYRLFETPENAVADFLRSGEFDGLNVTIPYKETVLPLMDELSPRAAAVGSVNTILRRGGRLYGDNTDCDGFSWLLTRAGIDPAGRKCLILGSGGSARTVRAVLSEAGAAEIVTVSRSGPDNYHNLSKHRDAELIVNTTPVGMYPEINAAPLSLDLFDRLTAVADLIYNPARTLLLQQAQQRGLRTSDGLPMLAAQAVRARERFDGTEIPDAVLEDVLNRLRRQMQNLLLIADAGLPETVGRMLADRLHRPLYAPSPADLLRYCAESGAVLTVRPETLRKLTELSPLRANSAVIGLNAPDADVSFDLTVAADDPETAVRLILEELGYENSHS